jgi:hypothetical protein
MILKIAWIIKKIVLEAPSKIQNGGKIPDAIK